jgi:hypothetical protein
VGTSERLETNVRSFAPFSFLSGRSNQILAVWLFAFVLALLGGGIVYFSTRSASALWPIVVIFFGSSVIGTLIAYWNDSWH